MSRLDEYPEEKKWEEIRDYYVLSSSYVIWLEDQIDELEEENNKLKVQISELKKITNLL